MSACYASAMIAPILSDTERTELAQLEAAVAAAREKGDTAAEEAAMTARDTRVIALHAAHDGRRGLIVEMGRAMGVHRSTVYRMFLGQEPGGRRAYRRAPHRVPHR